MKKIAIEKMKMLKEKAAMEKIIVSKTWDD